MCSILWIHNCLILQHSLLGCGVWLIQIVNQIAVAVEATDSACGNKNVIRVLHVDDDSSIQEITKLMLLNLNSSLEIDQACCVDEGISKLTDHRYDVIVSDYDMPMKSGLDFLQQTEIDRNSKMKPD